MGKKTVVLPPTEVVDPSGRTFDRLPVLEQLDRLLASQAQAIEAVRHIALSIGEAVDASADRLRGSDGRLMYAGAGCSIPTNKRARNTIKSAITLAHCFIY